jgi:hypothetical protein
VARNAKNSGSFAEKIRNFAAIWISRSKYVISRWKSIPKPKIIGYNWPLSSHYIVNFRIFNQKRWYERNCPLWNGTSRIHLCPILDDLMDPSLFSFCSNHLEDCLQQIAADPISLPSSTSTSTATDAINPLEYISTKRGKPSIKYLNNVFQERSQTKNKICHRWSCTTP